MSEYIISLLLLITPLSTFIAAWLIGQQSRASNGHVLFKVMVFNSIAFITAITLHQIYAFDLLSFLSLTMTRIIMLGLILFITLILIRFCKHYMQGEPRVNYFWRWLLLTITAVLVVVMSNHLALFWLGWVAISLALHKLLMFYPERPRAVLAAHKKFIVARVAESLLLIAFGILWFIHNSLYITDITAFYNTTTLPLSFAEQVAAFLIAFAALIKCAQLPIHGWLIKVVEVPTPVSALLHAGVINLGGFLLILFAPLFIQASAAQWLILIVAGLTTVISALIMTTRISVKVRLAWSTSAQMGLMLVECALGLFELALLHLVTHSTYKAFAFLNSGNGVNEDLIRRHIPKQSPTCFAWLTGALISIIIVGAAWVISSYQGAVSIWLLLASALTILLANQHGTATAKTRSKKLLIALLVVFSYVAAKNIFAFALPLEQWREPAFSLADSWVIALILTLMIASYYLRYQSWRPQVKSLSTLLFAGLYLDEWFTRLTLKIWPINLPNNGHTDLKNHAAGITIEESK
jgi:NAD(P)H-quinone oxidoreductase subunit 5